MQAKRWVAPAEIGCLAVFLAWLIWLPLPFGSVVERARLPLIAVPLGLVIAVAGLRLVAVRDRTNVAQTTRAWLIWGIGGAAFLAIGALQLVPLPPSMLAILSPESLRIWQSASRVVGLAGVPPRQAFPISIDPPATSLELLRMAALYATFTISALLMRTQSRRTALATTLCLAGSFEALYGIRQGALQQYEIWGWVNKLVFNRVTGTFVNPNHFGHYLAILLPMPLVLAAVAWRNTKGHAGGRLLPRLAAVFEQSTIRTSFSFAVLVTCTSALLLSQSRGAMLAAGCGVVFTVGLLPGNRVRRMLLVSGVAIVAVGALAVYFGAERTLHRFVPTDVEVNALGGRRIAVRAGFDLARRFPAFGSGLGTFDRVVTLEQRQGLELTYHHAHNDYVEIAATAGTVAFAIALVSFLGGQAALVRSTFGAASADLTWRRRAFQAAAIASITIAAVHALFDFNFYIPANPATLVAIAGAAVASVDHDRRTRR